MVETYSRKHLASQFGMEPLLPFHLVQWDPMHGAHNELNVLLDEVCPRNTFGSFRNPVLGTVHTKIYELVGFYVYFYMEGNPYIFLAPYPVHRCYTNTSLWTLLARRSWTPLLVHRQR